MAEPERQEPRSNGAPRVEHEVVQDTTDSRVRRSTDAVKEYRIVPLEQLLNPVSPPESIVSGLGITLGPITLVVGESDVGKTWVIQELAVSVISGSFAFGALPVVRQGRVAHLDFEQGLPGVQDRYYRLIQGKGLDRKSVLSALDLVCFPEWPLSDSTAVQGLQKLMQGHQLLIFDNLTAACPGTDWNDPRARETLDRLAKLSLVTGCCVLGLHHTRKPRTEDNGESSLTKVRGTAAIVEAAGTVLELHRSGKLVAVKDRNRLVQSGLSFHRRDLEDRAIRFEASGVPKPVSQTPMPSDKLSDEARILAALTRLGGTATSRSAIADNSGVRRGTVFKKIRELLDLGVLRENQDGTIVDGSGSGSGGSGGSRDTGTGSHRSSHAAEPVGTASSPPPFRGRAVGTDLGTDQNRLPPIPDRQFSSYEASLLSELDIERQAIQSEGTWPQ